MTKRWLTTKEAESYSNLCFKTLKKYYLQGEIVAKKVGSKWLWDRESIDRFLGYEDYAVKNMLSELGIRC